MLKKVSSCITKKFNGFHIVSLEYGKMLKKKFGPVDISFKPIKKKKTKSTATFQKSYICHIEAPTMKVIRLSIYQHFNVTIAIIFIE